MKPMIKPCKNCGESEHRLDSRGVWICISCIRNAKIKYVEANPERSKRQKREWYLKNKERILKEDKNIRMTSPDIMKEKRKLHYERRKAHIRERTKRYKDALKFEVLAHYSNGVPKCVMCGIFEVSKLALDHINDDGAQHRKEIGAGNRIYLWIRKNEFPQIFQILCHNCNIRKSHFLKKDVILHKNMSHQKIKQEVLAHYSSGEIKCAFCSENDYSVLTIDHINGNGSEHRRSIGRRCGVPFYRWLKNHNYPVGYQILCFNCNMSKN